MKKTLTLAKALKLKNKLVGDIAKTQQIIKRENSKLVTAKRNFVVEDLYAEFLEKTEDLIRLKIAINEANVTIQPIIYRMAELKNQILFINSISTQDGTVEKQYSDGTEEYNAIFKDIWAVNSVELLGTAIEDFQDALDDFNHKTIIKIDIL